MKQNQISGRFLTVILAAETSLSLLPVHDQSHLSGEAIATVHTQVPGHARVCAHVRLQ